VRARQTLCHDIAQYDQVIEQLLLPVFSPTPSFRVDHMTTSGGPEAKHHCMHGSAMQVVIGHIAFKGEMANFDLSYLRHR
jgi:hypothetical protein